MTGEFILQIKTPLWTGDIDAKSKRIRATGFMGSLRWWAEALLRGHEPFCMRSRY